MFRMRILQYRKALDDYDKIQNPELKEQYGRRFNRLPYSMAGMAFTPLVTLVGINSSVDESSLLSRLGATAAMVGAAYVGMKVGEFIADYKWERKDKVEI